jgi:hypothetical protein
VSEHKLPREPVNSRDPEVFQCFEAATGTRLPMREATDEQLVRFIADAGAQAKHHMTEAMKHIGISTNCSKAESCMQYELDRRKRTIAIVTDLSNIQGLRRQ